MVASVRSSGIVIAHPAGQVRIGREGDRVRNDGGPADSHVAEPGGCSVPGVNGEPRIRVRRQDLTPYDSSVDGDSADVIADRRVVMQPTIGMAERWIDGLARVNTALDGADLNLLRIPRRTGVLTSDEYLRRAAAQDFAADVEVAAQRAAVDHKVVLVSRDVLHRIRACQTPVSRGSSSAP